MTRPRLDLLAGPDRAADLVLLAHGGQERSLDMPPDWGHAALRMWPFAAAARAAVPHARVGLLRYRYRGWNDDAAHAAADLHQVLHEALPDVSELTRRVVLVGHSMGGRAVLAAAGAPCVVGALGLAPWLPAEEPMALPADRAVVLAHGDQDRRIDPRLTARFARRARRAGVPVALYDVQGDSHAMLRRPGDWDELVRRFTRAVLGGEPDAALVRATSTDPDHGADPLPRWSRRRGPVAAVAGIGAARLWLRPG